MVPSEFLLGKDTKKPKSSTIMSSRRFVYGFELEKITKIMYLGTPFTSTSQYQTSLTNEALSVHASSSRSTGRYIESAAVGGWRRVL